MNRTSNQPFSRRPLHSRPFCSSSLSLFVPCCRRRHHHPISTFSFYPSPDPCSCLCPWIPRTECRFYLSGQVALKSASRSLRNSKQRLAALKKDFLSIS